MVASQSPCGLANLLVCSQPSPPLRHCKGYCGLVNGTRWDFLFCLAEWAWVAVLSRCGGIKGAALRVSAPLACLAQAHLPPFLQQYPPIGHAVYLERPSCPSPKRLLVRYLVLRSSTLSPFRTLGCEGRRSTEVSTHHRLYKIE